MKTFFQSNAPTYYYGNNVTLAIRKDCIEFYRRLKDRGHAVVNVEVFSDAVRLSIVCGSFSDDLFGKVLKNGGISVEKHPRLTELLSGKSKYVILNEVDGGNSKTRILYDIEKSFPNYLEAIGSPEIMSEVRSTVEFFISLYNELCKSTSPAVKALAGNFYK